MKTLKNYKEFINEAKVEEANERNPSNEMIYKLVKDTYERLDKFIKSNLWSSTKGKR